MKVFKIESQRRKLEKKNKGRDWETDGEAAAAAEHVRDNASLVSAVVKLSYLVGSSNGNLGVGLR